ncbi:MAG: SdiA-regulated domain-containing protein [Rhodothermales bacterium]
MLRPLAGLLLIALVTSGCGNGEPPGASASTASPARADGAAPPYRFDAPTAQFELPGRLDEISGLTALDGDRLGAVQDEDGVLYVIDAATGEVTHEHDFGKDGDYEGVERVGERVVVLRSDGELAVIEDWQAEKARAPTLDPGLHGSCDAEGLGYDADAARLLIACKESPGRGLRGVRAVYAFDLATNTLDPEPAFVIAAESLAASDGERAVDETVRALVRPLVDINTFKPSALGVHPVTGEVYVLSSVRKALAVLDRAGSVTAVWPLPERLLPQPEAIAFFPDGTLFLASEADGDAARLLRYDYQPAR